MCDPVTQQTSLLSNATDNIAELPTYQFFPELVSSFSDPDISFQRGIFQKIQAARIDLPPTRATPDPANAKLWIQRLPEHVKPIFDEATSPFQEAIRTHIDKVKEHTTLPRPHIYASQQEYIALLAQIERAGMLHWSIIPEEVSEYTAIASDIEMTLFAVTKSRARNRLISWPRVQNDATPQRPYTSLPNPAMFEAIRM